MRFTKAILFAASLSFSAQTLLAAPATMERQPDGITLHLDSGDLRIQVLSDAVVRVAFAHSPSFFTHASIDVIPHAPIASGWKLAERPAAFILSTMKLQVTIDRNTGAVSFADAQGHPILAEASGSRSLEPAAVQGESTFHIQQKWKAQADESLYGLGAMQLGITDIKGYDLDLWQHNTNMVVPFLVSSRGYGILWDNTSFTRFGDLRPFAAIPAAQLYDSAGVPGGLTLAPVDGSEPARQTADISINLLANRAAQPGVRPAPLKRQRWQGSILAPATGDYQFQAYSNGGIQVWFDGNLVMNHWRQNWNPTNDQVRVHLLAGHKYPIRIENDPEQQIDPDLPLEDVRRRRRHLALVAGRRRRRLLLRCTALPSIRSLPAIASSPARPPCCRTGPSACGSRASATRPPINRWTWSGSSASARFPSTTSCRTGNTGAPMHGARISSTPRAFPIPTAGSRPSTTEHAHLMISVWGKFNPNTDNAKEMNAKGFLYQPNLNEHMLDWIGQPYTFYDAFNPAARQLFWSQIDTALFAKGIDAWWMDATEPDFTAFAAHARRPADAHESNLSRHRLANVEWLRAGK